VRLTGAGRLPTQQPNRTPAARSVETVAAPQMARIVAATRCLAHSAVPIGAPGMT